MRIKVAPAVSIAAPAAVVPPSSTEQSQPAGTALVDHTFGAWSDDDSRIAYFAPELVGDTGSMTVSDGGSDDSAGPWSFTGDADGNNGALLLHAFDSDDNYLGTAVHGFERESGGLGIQNIASRDYKNTDALDISAAGLHSLAKGSTPYATIEVSKNGAIVVSASAGTAGLTFAHTSGISGSWNIAEDITAELSGGGALTAADWSGTKILHLMLAGISFDRTNGARLAVGLCDTDALPISADLFLGGLLEDNGTNCDIGTRRYEGSGVDANTDTGQPDPVRGCWSIVIYEGLYAIAYWHGGATSYPANPRSGHTHGPYSIGRSSISQGAMPLEFASLFAALGIAQDMNATWEGWKLDKVVEA